MSFMQVGMMGSVVDSPIPRPPALGSPKLATPTHHQDPIGDDFRRRHLATKDEGLMGRLNPSRWLLL